MTYATRVPVIIQDEYVVSFERWDGSTFIHCTVNKWGNEVAKKLKHHFDSLCEMHREPIYAVHEKNDRKHEKFLKLYGFNYYRSVTGSDAIERDIYVRSLYGN